MVIWKEKRKKKVNQSLFFGGGRGVCAYAKQRTRARATERNTQLVSAPKKKLGGVKIVRLTVHLKLSKCFLVRINRPLADPNQMVDILVPTYY
jgi:hypothetical protein